jgi:regulatory protein
MGKITAIESQARHANRFNIYIDDAFALGVSAILAAKLRVGQSLGETELAALERAEAYETAHEKALRFLEPRPRSATEVRQQLFKKKIAADVIDEVIVRLTDAGLLNDKAFAKYWVENRETFRPRAGRALKYEMKRKGLSDQTIASALKGVDEDESAFRAGGARARRWFGLEHRDYLQKMIPFLVRRGFAYEIAKRAAERLWKDKDVQED